tara:strand:+ start:389 stop:553 length:165 start_codon:yes stop_codon:yes gene_type:complete
MVLGMIRIPAFLANQEAGLVHVHNLRLEVSQGIPEPASVTKAERFPACGKRLTQ